MSKKKRNDGTHPVLKLLKALKQDYETRFGKCTYEPCGIGANHTCVNRWIDDLGDEKYKNVFSGIVLHQYKALVNFHYSPTMRALDLKGGRIPSDEYFDAYGGLYMECRGTVMDVEDEKIVLLPFRKFFNLGECELTSLKAVERRLKDAHRVEFSEKLDGSMISAGYYRKETAPGEYDEETVVSGSSSLDPLYSIQVSRAKAYIEKHENYKEMIFDLSDTTFIFEYISKIYDPHIVSYDDDETLYLVGMRNIETGVEHSYESVIRTAKAYSVPSTKVYFDETLEDVLSKLGEKKASEAEGFVMNIDGFKVKIKYDDYVMIHKTAAASESPNYIVRLIADGKDDDVYASLPASARGRFLRTRDNVLEAVDRIEKRVEGYLKKTEGMEKKEAMLWIQENVRREYQGFVRERYLGRETCILKERSGRYRTYKELKELAGKCEPVYPN